MLGKAELFRTCARLADDIKSDGNREEAVLQATRMTLCLLAQRIGQLTEQIQDLEGRLVRGWSSPAEASRRPMPFGFSQVKAIAAAWPQSGVVRGANCLIPTGGRGYRLGPTRRANDLSAPYR